MGTPLRKLCPCMISGDILDDQTAVVSRYQGEKNCLGQKHGYGSYMLNNGDLYEGCWRYNKMHGYGVYTYTSGEKKEGFFESGKYIGKEVALFNSHEDQPKPFAQTTRDEEAEAKRQQRNLEREKRRIAFEAGREDRRRRREEFFKKYGDRRHREQTKPYGATKHAAT